MEDIIKIKQNSDVKVKDLYKVHKRELEAMKIENAYLRKEIKESKEEFNKTLASKDEKFQATLDSKDKDIKYYNSEKIIQRKSRSVVISHLSQVLTII